MTPAPRRRGPSRGPATWSGTTWAVVAAVIGVLALIGWATGAGHNKANLTTGNEPLPSTNAPLESSPTTYSPQPSGTASPQSTVSPAATPSATETPGSCHARGSGLYVLPDPSCTPGSRNPDVTQANIYDTICRSGWTSTVRPPVSYTEPLKYQQKAAYGETGPISSYEEDHLIPLELGGSPRSPQNLWPEPGATPNPKDSVENAVKSAVCNGSMTLATAQQAIASNWIVLGQQLGVVSSQPSNPQPASPPPSGSSAGSCTVSASYNSRYSDYDVYVHSNQPNQTVTVSASGGTSASYHTDSSGYADVYLHVTGSPAGQRVTATVGSASCSTTL